MFSYLSVKLYYLITIVVLIVVFWGCGTEIVRPDEDQMIPFKVDQVTYDLISNGEDVSFLTQKVNIDSIRQNKTTGLLSIYLNYEGGCLTHEFEILISQTAIDDNNPQLPFVLLHKTDGDRCLAKIGNKYTLDLTKLPFTGDWFNGEEVSILNSTQTIIEDINPVKAVFEDF